MTFYKNDLWVVNDRIVGDTTVFRPSSNDSGIYKIYSILKVDTARGTISDSIFIVAIHLQQILFGELALTNPSYTFHTMADGAPALLK